MLRVPLQFSSGGLHNICARHPSTVQMDHAVAVFDVTRQDQRIADTIRREQDRLRNFIYRRVGDFDDAEDILQDVFYELVEATRLMKPIEHASAWLFRVARNRITDRFRRRKPEVSIDAPMAAGAEGELSFEDLLPSAAAGPRSPYTVSGPSTFSTGLVTARISWLRASS